MLQKQAETRKLEATIEAQMKLDIAIIDLKKQVAEREAMYILDESKNSFEF